MKDLNRQGLKTSRAFPLTGRVQHCVSLLECLAVLLEVSWESSLPAGTS